MAIVTFTTDFGRRDHYVAAMKGIILQIAPKTPLIDVTHQIEPQGVLRAAFVVRQIWPSFPRGTVHVAVVDPGVGTERRIIVAQYAGQTIVCPDNGIVSLLHRDMPLEMLRTVANRELFAQAEPATTFHGRDIIAPVAGHLSRGVKPTEIGPPTDQLEILDMPKPERLPDRSVRGEVIYVDAFGNLVTNLTRDDLAHTFVALPDAHVWLGDHDVGKIQQTYAQVESGQPLALVGSVDLLEIAVNYGNAAEHFNADTGIVVTVK
jgi:S-adenosylmethionine hydrolase